MTNFFFEDETLQEIAQDHIEKVVSLELSESERIMKLYRKVRHELRDRLDSIPSGTFTDTKMRATLAQVDLAIKAMSESLTDGMSDSADRAAVKGIENLIKELNVLNKHFKGSAVPINLDAAVISTDINNFLVERYQSSIDAYSSAVRSRIAQGISEAVVRQSSFDEVVGTLGKTFMGEEWKLQQLARTELHNVYSQGKLRGMNDLWDDGDGVIPDLKKGLFQPMDTRTGKDSVYADHLELVVSIDEPFRYRWQGKERVFMAPPDRPNDRSILIPFRESWKK